MSTGVSNFYKSKDLAFGHGRSARSNSRDRLPFIGWDTVDNERTMTRADGVAYVRTHSKCED